eukprot:gene4226-12086_t
MLGFDDNGKPIPEWKDNDAHVQAAWAKYRKRYEGKRNVKIFREVNTAMRLFGDAVLLSSGEKRNARRWAKDYPLVMKWVKYLWVLFSSTHSITAKAREEWAENLQHFFTDFTEKQADEVTDPTNSDDLRAFRGTANLPLPVVERHAKLKPGQLLGWAAPSSTSLLSSGAEAFVGEDPPSSILFILSDVSQGSYAAECSQYPEEMEVLLALATVFEVVRVDPAEEGRPLVVSLRLREMTCFAHSRLLHALSEEVREDELRLWSAEELPPAEVTHAHLCVRGWVAARGLADRAARASAPP